MALSTRLRRRLRESLSYGLALEGISAAQVAALNVQKPKEGRASLLVVCGIGAAKS
jgi:hypothetical protein